MEDVSISGDKMYYPRSKSGMTPLYQTLHAIASGTTQHGVDITTKADRTGKSLDAPSEFPSSLDAQIAYTGQVPNKSFSRNGLNTFFGSTSGREFLECGQETLVSIGYYHPYTQQTAHENQDPKLWRKSQLKTPPLSGQEALGQLYLGLRHIKLGYNFTNIETESFDIPEVNPQKGTKPFPKMLIFISSRMLSQSVQHKLLNYARNGGHLCIFGDLPQVDEHSKPRTLLHDVVSARFSKKTFWNNGSSKTLRWTHYFQGTILYHQRNPFEARKGFRFYMIDLLSRVLLKMGRFGIPKWPLVEGKINPYSYFSAKIGSVLNPPSLRRGSLKSTHLLLRYLQKHGITRKVEMSVRTDYIFRHKLDVFLYSHPHKNVQYIFIFSKDTHWTLPVSIRLYIPERSFSLRIRTNILGHTSQLIRIENGELSGFIYTGVSPRSHMRAKLFLKINKTVISTSDPGDIVYSRAGNRAEVFLTYGKFKYNKITFLKGVQDNPIAIHDGHNQILFESKK